MPTYQAFCCVLTYTGYLVWQQLVIEAQELVKLWLSSVVCIMFWFQILFHRPTQMKIMFLWDFSALSSQLQVDKKGGGLASWG